MRVTGIGDDLADRRRTEWQLVRARGSAVGALRSRTRWPGQSSLGYVGAVVFVVVGLDASVGSVLLILAAGARLSAYVGGTIGEIGFLRGIWLDGSRRLACWRNYTAASADTDITVPERLVDGITWSTFRLPTPGPGISRRTSPRTCPPVPWSQSSGKTARGSPHCEALAKMYNQPWRHPDRRPAAAPDVDGRVAQRRQALSRTSSGSNSAQQHGVGLGDLRGSTMSSGDRRGAESRSR